MSRNVYIVLSFLVVSRKKYIYFNNTYIFALKFRFIFLKTWIIHVYVSQLQKTKNCSYWQFSWTWIQVYIFWVWNDGKFFFFCKINGKINLFWFHLCATWSIFDLDWFCTRIFSDSYGALKLMKKCKKGDEKNLHFPVISTKYYI